MEYFLENLYQRLHVLLFSEWTLPISIHIHTEYIFTNLHFSFSFFHFSYRIEFSFNIVPMDMIIHVYMKHRICFCERMCSFCYCEIAHLINSNDNHWEKIIVRMTLVQIHTYDILSSIALKFIHLYYYVGTYYSTSSNLKLSQMHYTCNNFDVHALVKKNTEK